MNKLEILMNEKKHITSICLEKDTSLYGTKQRLNDYNEVLKIKNKNARLKDFLFSSSVISIMMLLITFLIYKSSFGSLLFESVSTYFEVNKYIVFISVFMGGQKTLVNYISDLKKYKGHGKRYNDLSFLELKEKINEVTENYKDGFDLEKLQDRYTSYFEEYDYILGDWSYGKLRLKGFCIKGNKLLNKINDFENVKDYIKNQCTYDCRYFIIKKIDYY